MEPHRLSQLWLDACEEVGIPKTDDYNGANMLGKPICFAFLAV
jgi:hypothetical protein